MGDTLKKHYLNENEILILLQAIENGEIETIYSYIKNHYPKSTDIIKYMDALIKSNDIE